MKRIGFITCAAAFLVATCFTPVQASTSLCKAITLLPAKINRSGVYCLKTNLRTGMISGNAITINADNVVLDLNGFMIDNLAAGAGTETNGIYAYQRQNITVRNGTLRGFYIGINLKDTTPYTTSAGHLIEEIRASQNRAIGIFMAGTGSTIRNNQVAETGGSTLVPDAYAINTVGNGTRVLANDVENVAAYGNGDAFGIYAVIASNSTVAGNRVSNLSAPVKQGTGIFLASGINIIVRDNSLSGMALGIKFQNSGVTGKYMNNVVWSTSTPYTFGTPAGSTNY